MERRLRRVAIALGLLTLGLLACHKVPFTNRVQFNLVPDGVMDQIGAKSYLNTLQQNSVVHGSAANGVLNKVGARIATQASQPKFKWQYNLIDSTQVNAWCLPGGKIAFYTGILPIVRDEAGMAFVMGHEVGHAVARHGAERMTTQLTLLGGMAGLELFLSNRSKLTPAQQAGIMAAIGLTAEVGVMLPYSRHQESEADVIGLMYMSGAGYPPGESIKMWDRMDQLAGGKKVPAFLSTHPSNAQRKRVLSGWMDNARKRYQRNKLRYDTLKTLWQ